MTSDMVSGVHTVRTHHDLVVWQKSVDFVEVVYRLTQEFPGDERFGLTSQLRRAAVSIPSNIAEGAARKSKLEFAQFISIALGSAAEVETQVEIARRLSLCQQTSSATQSVRVLIRMLSALRQSLSDK